jgi:hypothetical protein
VGCAARGDAAKVAQLLAGGADPDGELVVRTPIGLSVGVSPLVAVVTEEGHSAGPGHSKVFPSRRPFTFCHRQTVSDNFSEIFLKGLNFVLLKVVRLLLEAGAHPNLKTDAGFTAPEMAASCGRLEIVRLLLHAGADPNAMDGRGSTMLLAAVDRGHLEVLRLLLAWDADPDAAWKDRGAVHHTAFHFACATNRPDCVEARISMGGEVILCVLCISFVVLHTEQTWVRMTLAPAATVRHFCGRAATPASWTRTGRRAKRQPTWKAAGRC